MNSLTSMTEGFWTFLVIVWNNESFKSIQNILSFCHKLKLYFLITIFFQPDCGNLWYFNLDYLIYQNSEFENTPWGYKDIETKKSKFGAKTQFLCGRHILAVFLVPAKHWFIILNILKGNLTAFSEKCIFLILYFFVQIRVFVYLDSSD